MGDSILAAFARTIGIDYSVAQTPTASLKGLRAYLAESGSPPVEVLPPPSPKKYWTRRGIAEWLVERLTEDTPTLVGIDHGFSFPLRYFEAHRLKPDWPGFLDDFQRHWPTDEDHTYVEFVRDGIHGNGAARMGNARWRREVGLPFRRAGIGGEINPCGHSLVALPPPTVRQAGSFLAVRWLGDSGRAIGDCRGLSGPVVARVCQRRSYGRPA